ncbi:Alpha-copaene synthase [Handroanthus impetiginosus]|uniref:Alpha-copaene synthase n=1 Tax=Handroanthus impetiginosus TaxID=429701 RepID=A0A2G9G8D1_9LAMI|nr:Alpha-copaene synthase [Handroanthus impetiginosus]
MRQLRMVDSIQRLGIAYHFEEEIDQCLQDLFEKFDDYFKDKDDMYTTALSFRLLRQHGYRVSCKIFDKFKDVKGDFKVSNTDEEVMGMLEFYEATHLRIHGEDILDHGFVFSRNYLESVLPRLTNPVTAEQVHHALTQYSIRRGLPRLEARHYISVYEQYASCHEGILRLAKLDFNLNHGFVFSRNYLESVLPRLTNPVTAEQVHHAGLPRLEARHYISVYEQYASCHEGLLRLAKLDCNLLQSLHKRELAEQYRDTLQDFKHICQPGKLTQVATEWLANDNETINYKLARANSYEIATK